MVTGVAVFIWSDYMENIITDILKIEADAQKRLADAEEESIKILADAKAEKENIINAKIQEAENRITMLNSDEKTRAEKTLADIEQNRINEIGRIDNIYNESHTEWEENIFNQIICG